MGATEEPTERLDSMEGMKGEEDGLKTVPQEADLTCRAPPFDPVGLQEASRWVFDRGAFGEDGERYCCTPPHRSI